MPELTETREPPSDWTDLFFRYLSDEKDASVYTQRNYRQALGEFAQWHRDTNESPVCWSELERNDFRLFLRQLGRRELSQAAIRLRFSALNSFYKFLMRRGLVESSPVKDVTLPKPAKRLPQFLTIDQMNALLDAPMQEFEAERVAKKGTKKKANQVPYLRDGAILETIYSCGLRIGEICRMLAGEIEPDEHVVNVHGKGKKERQVPIGRAAVEAARRAFGVRDGFVLGDIGPFGGLMEPYGEITRAEVDRAFAEQAKALVEAGADAIIVETQTVLDEAGAAIAAAKAAGAQCVIASMAFDFTHETHELRTMMGTDPDEAAAFLEAAGADVLGLNCGTNIDMARALAAVQRYRECSALPIMAQPNAGQPVLQNLKVIYNQAPEEMAAQAGDMLEADVAILGACCGSTPAHIAGLRGRMNQFIETQPQIG